MNAASHALHQATNFPEFVKNLPPLKSYKHPGSPPQLEYQDQISWITNYAAHNACSERALVEARSKTWQQMLESLEAVNRIRHPYVGEEYIKWRSQDMLVRRLWPAARFPGVDPDRIYTSIRRRYCNAARRLVGKMDEQGSDYMDVLVKLNETYNKKLTAERKAIETYIKKLAARREAKNAAQAIEAEDGFVVVEWEHEDEGEGCWEEDGWDTETFEQLTDSAIVKEGIVEGPVVVGAAIMDSNDDLEDIESFESPLVESNDARGEF
ncbi:hypothetical protein DSL72_000947 [Monilinia vaccinii-corymbosi]|uniref:Uncharacterized protein n=1 Tax=Monilinia vaccinii-corymbosi TaxID=61207 RepID=A0A8A3P2V8_9HELO|nr:hypothetical protein DSL72_000947 [Monilinia vaccinii-corymbosi]